jgi:hypothetical protein
MRLVIEGNRAPAPQTDLALLKAVARAHQWSENLLIGQASSIAEVAEREGVGARYVRRLMRLAFLAPKIVEMIAAGRQPSELTAEALAERIDLPLLWTAQEKLRASDSQVRSFTHILTGRVVRNRVAAGGNPGAWGGGGGRSAGGLGGTGILGLGTGDVFPGGNGSDGQGGGLILGGNGATGPWGGGGRAANSSGSAVQAGAAPSAGGSGGYGGSIAGGSGAPGIVLIYW